LPLPSQRQSSRSRSCSRIYFRPEVNAVAQLASPQGGEPAFVVSVLDDKEKLLIRAATVAPMPNNSYELWVVPQTGAPISLGVVEQTGETERDVAENVRPLLVTGGTLAVSLEPVGGSTTGAPTTVILSVRDAAQRIRARLSAPERRGSLCSARQRGDC
jgi:anti-sigma-K factor RskA